MVKPLQNRTIVITRAAEQAGKSIAKLESLGAIVIPYPTIKVNFNVDLRQLERCLKQIEKYHYIIFTSANAVKAFYYKTMKGQLKHKLDNLRIVAVGDKTSEICKNHGFNVDIIPKEFSSEGLISELIKIVAAGENVLIPSSALSKSALKESLENIGAKVDQPIVYSIEKPGHQEIFAAKKQLKKTKIDLFIFTSPSTFIHFLELENISEPQKYFMEAQIAVIGKTTKEAVNFYKVNVDIIPEEFTMNSLVTQIENYYELKNASAL